MLFTKNTAKASKKEVATGRGTEGKEGAARADGRDQATRGAEGEGKRSGGLWGIIKTAGRKVRTVLREKGSKPSAFDAFRATHLVAKLDCLLDIPGQLIAEQAGILASLKSIDVELANDLEDGLASALAAEEAGLGSLARYLSWVLTGLRAGKWEREGAGSFSSRAFVVEQIIPILQFVCTLFSLGQPFDVLALAAPLYALDPDAALALNTICEANISNEEKTEAILDVIEDLEVSVRCYWDELAGSTMHLLNSSFIIPLDGSSTPVFARSVSSSSSSPASSRLSSLASASVSASFSLPSAGQTVEKLSPSSDNEFRLVDEWRETAPCRFGIVVASFGVSEKALSREARRQEERFAKGSEDEEEEEREEVLTPEEGAKASRVEAWWK